VKNKKPRCGTCVWYTHPQFVKCTSNIDGHQYWSHWHGCCTVRPDVLTKEPSDGCRFHEPAESKEEELIDRTAALMSSRDSGKRQEREAVVAYLRDDDSYPELADDIEAGAHRNT
jgi:hypothetical protein